MFIDRTCGNSELVCYVFHKAASREHHANMDLTSKSNSVVGTRNAPEQTGSVGQVLIESCTNRSTQKYKHPTKPRVSCLQFTRSIGLMSSSDSCFLPGARLHNRSALCPMFPGAPTRGSSDTASLRGRSRKLSDMCRASRVNHAHSAICKTVP